MVGGLAALMFLRSDGSGGGVDLFTEDLATEGIDPAAFINPPEADGESAQPVGDDAVGSAQFEGTTQFEDIAQFEDTAQFGAAAGELIPGELSNVGGEDGVAIIVPGAEDDSGAEAEPSELSNVIAGDSVANVEGPVEVDRIEATTATNTPLIANADSPFTSPGTFTQIPRVTPSLATTTNRFSPAAPFSPTTTTPLFIGPGAPIFSPAPAPVQAPAAVTPTTGGPNTVGTVNPTARTNPTIGVGSPTPQAPATTTSPFTQTTPTVDPVTPAQPIGPAPATTTTTTTTTPVPVAPTGPWCQVEVRANDGIIRWDDDGRTTVFRLNDRWFHTPDEAAQAVQIPETVNTNDQYVMRLWVGGTTDVLCTFVNSAQVFQAPAQTATPTTTPVAVANVAALPAPIGVPGGPVQIGFSADLWAEDRAQYWSELQAVPGAGRLIAHEFKSFDKPINTDLFRWHQESGRDLLLTWNGTDAETILNGSNDDWIREHARQLRSLPDTVMLRFWHEPDVQHKREWIDHDPQQFIDSWIYVRQIFAEENATNIEWVWCPTAWNWNEQGARYYPGDANVDWICSDGYSGWDLDAPLPHIRDAYTDFQAWANQRPHKPILIAEFGAGQRGPGERAEWVQGIDDWVAASPNIRAVVYFDVDRRPHGEIYDWRLRTEPDAWAAMLDIISSAPFGR